MGSYEEKIKTMQKIQIQFDESFVLELLHSGVVVGRWVVRPKDSTIRVIHGESEITLELKPAPQESPLNL